LFAELAFWAPCRFWLLIPCLMFCWQRFSPISVGCLFSLVTISFVVQKLLVWCNPTCQFFF
jgi:hypothetical protein